MCNLYHIYKLAGACMYNQDSITTLQSLKDIMKEIIAERDWQQFHSPKNLALKLSLESSELLEKFEWMSEDPAVQLVVYKALYDTPEFGKNSIWVRPYTMFTQTVMLDGQMIPRFKKVDRVPEIVE